MFPNAIDLKSPKFWASIIGMVLAALAAFGVLSPSTLAGVQDPLTKIAEAVLVILSQVAILVAAWKQVPAGAPTPTLPKPATPDQPTLF